MDWRESESVFSKDEAPEEATPAPVDGPIGNTK